MQPEENNIVEPQVSPDLPEQQPQVVEQPKTQINKASSTSIEAPKQPEQRKVTPIKQKSPEVIQDELATTGRFKEMIEGGASNEELKDFAVQNKQFSNMFKLQLKNLKRQDKNKQVVNRFGNKSNEELLDAVNRGEIVPGSKEYNQIPGEVRQNFESFKAENDAIVNTSNGKTDLSKVDNILEIETPSLSEGYLAERRGLREDFNSNPEVSKSRDKINTIKNQISDIDDSIESIEDDIIDNAKGVPQSLLNARIFKEQNELRKQKTALGRDLNNELALYTDLKNDFNDDVQALDFEFGIEQQAATQEFNFQIQKANAVIEQQAATEEARLAQQQAAEKRAKEAIELQLKIEKHEADIGDQKARTALTFEKFAFEQGGEARELNSWKFKELFKHDLESANLDLQEFTNSNGDTFVYDRNTGQKMYNLESTKTLSSSLSERSKYGITENQSGGITIGVTSTEDVPKKRRQCGAFVNDILNGGPGLFGNSYESKAQKINSDTPLAGSAFIQDWGTEYGHVGMVEQVNYDTKGNVESIDIIDSNRRGTQQIERRNIEVGSGEWNKITGYHVPKEYDKRANLSTLARGFLDGTAEINTTSKDGLAVQKELLDAGVITPQTGNVRFLSEDIKGKESVRALISQLKDFNRLAELSDKFGTGFFESSRMNPKHFKNDDWKEMRRLTGKNFAENLKRLSGAAASDSEVKRLSEVFPTISMGDTAYDEAVEGQIDGLNQILQNLVTAYGFEDIDTMINTMGLGNNFNDLVSDNDA